MVPAFFLDGWFNPFTMAEIGGIVGALALGAAVCALLGRTRVSERCRRCRFDLRGATHRACPECGASLASKRSRATTAWVPRRKLAAANAGIAFGGLLFFIYPDPLVRALKDGAARGLSDRELVERTLGADGNEVLAYHDARTREIARGLRTPDGSIEDFAALSEAIDRASREATDDELASELLAADRAGFFALQTTHLLVADRSALARQLLVEVLEPTDLSTAVANARRTQAMRACVQTDEAVRLALVANKDFLARSKTVVRSRRSGAAASRTYVVVGNPELLTSGIDRLLFARVESIVLRGSDGSTKPVRFRASSDQAAQVLSIEIDPPEHDTWGTLVFTVEIEAHPAGMRATAEREQPVSRCVTELEISYTPSPAREPGGA